MKLAMALVALVSTPAFAGSQGLSFSDILEACQNPSKFQNQIAPSNIQISCEEHLTKWVQDTGKGVKLNCSRTITSGVSSDKYQVSPTEHAMPVEDQDASCPNFKEVMESTSFTKATTCDELLNWKGTEEDLCADILDRARKENDKIVQITDTGKTAEFCSEQGKGQDQGQQQEKGKEQGKGGQGKIVRR